MTTVDPRAGLGRGPLLRADRGAADRARRARLIAALALAGGLVGCGFRLRGAAALPFDTLYLGFGPNSPFGTELARNIRAGSGTRVVEDRAQAAAIFELLSESRERDVLSVNAQGRAREIQLRLRVAFRVHDGKGRDLIAPTQLVAQRDLAYSEEQVLAKEAEEVLLFRDMQSDLVQQLLRRMAAARPSAG